jgi:pimeloyl-ACP methyl ester carboxylesterase
LHLVTINPLICFHLQRSHPTSLSQPCQVILFDNRDAGESNRASQPYTLADMADNVAGLLEALGISAAHIMGVSMGCMTAHDTCDRLDQITAPTLVITGDRDRAIPPKNGNLLSAAIADANLNVVPDVGHGFCFSHPDLTVAIATDFLKR